MNALILGLIEFNKCENINTCTFDLQNKHFLLRLQSLIESYYETILYETTKPYYTKLKSYNFQ